MKNILRLLAFLLLWPTIAHASQTYAALPITGTLSGLTAVNDINANNDALLTTFLGTSAPGSPEAGMLWTDSTNHQVKYYDGTQFEVVGFYNATTGVFSADALSILNATTTGTTANKLVKLSGAPSKALITTTTDTGGVIGIAASGAGTSGSVVVNLDNYAACIFDGATTAGDYVQISTSTAGDCHDVGSTYPTSGQILGRVVTTNGSGGTFTVFLFGPEAQGSAGGGGGSGTVTSVATTSPITGGTFTTSGTIACATCVVASAPGVGIAHFAGSTQTVTSSAVSLSADVTGNLGVAHLNSGTSATSSTFWRGDGTWAAPAGSGTVTTTGTPASGNLAKFSGSTSIVNGDLSGDATTSGTLVVTVVKVNGDANVSFLDANQSYTKGQAVTPTAGGTQSSGGTLTPDFSASNSITFTFGAGNLTIANPTNVKAGQSYELVPTQDSVGGRTITWGTNWKFGGGTPPTLSTGANDKDFVSCFADTTTTINCTLAIVNAH